MMTTETSLSLTDKLEQLQGSKVLLVINDGSLSIKIWGWLSKGVNGWWYLNPHRQAEQRFHVDYVHSVSLEALRVELDIR